MASAYDAIYRNTKYVVESTTLNRLWGAPDSFHELDTRHNDPETPGHLRSYRIIPSEGDYQGPGVSDLSRAVSEDTVFIDIFYPSTSLTLNEVYRLIFEDRKDLVQQLNSDENYTGAVDADDERITSSSEDVGILGRWVTSAGVSSDDELTLFTLRITVSVTVDEVY